MYATMLATPALAVADLSTSPAARGRADDPESVIESWGDADRRSSDRAVGMTELSGLGFHPRRLRPTSTARSGWASRQRAPGVSTEDGVTECAPGDPGELVARGPLVTLGYYHDDAATAEAFTSDGWLRTGDNRPPTTVPVGTLASWTGSRHDPDRRLQRVPRGDRAGYLIGHASVALVAVGRDRTR